jgi:hypothetical protein
MNLRMKHWKINRGKMESLMGTHPLTVQCIKKEEGRKTIDKQLFPSLQVDCTEGGTSSQ